MGDLRKNPYKKQGLLTKAFGRKDGLTVKGKVKGQDTGKAFGRGTVSKKPIRRMGQGI